MTQRLIIYTLAWLATLCGCLLVVPLVAVALQLLLGWTNAATQQFGTWLAGATCTLTSWLLPSPLDIWRAESHSHEQG